MGGAQAAFGRFWVAGRIGSWSVLVFGAKWIIRGRRRVRCGRPACITNTCLWHNLRLVHRFEDSRGTRIINPWSRHGRHNRALTNILMHGVSWHIRTAHVTWVQAAGETVRTARSARGNTGTRAGPNGETGEIIASLTSGSAHCTGKPRGSGWDSGRTKLPNPRAPPTPSDADRGGGWERVRRDCRAEGSLEAAAQSKR